MGYFDDLKEEKQPSKEKKESSYFSDLPKEPSKLRSFLLSIPRGIIKARKSIPTALPSMVPQKLQERLFEEEFPILEEHKPIERGAKIAIEMAAFPGSLPLKAAEAGLGAFLGHQAEEEGVGELGQGLLESVGVGIPSIAKSLGKNIGKASKTSPELMKSGLPKLKATESKFSKLGTLSKERQEFVIDKLNKESSKLSKKSIEKHLPLSKEVQKGFDFENNLNQGFKNLRASAEKANPRIDVTPISDLIESSIEKYRGIPRPSSEVVKIKNEVKAFIKKPQTSLNNLLKIFRDNNKKLKEIYEKSFLLGKQRDYRNFLRDMNEAISKSFEKTLPQDSAWMKQFKDLNADYKKLQDAKKTLYDLRGILSDKPKFSQVSKLAEDPMMQKKLSLSMGKEGSDEIIQIAKDLKLATESIKNIPKSKLSKFDKAFPLYFLIPWIGKYLGLAKGLEAARYGYGWLLSTQKNRSNLRAAINAILRDDLDGYKKVVANILHSLKEED